MAIFKDFIEKVDFDAVWALLGNAHEEMEQYKDAYAGIFRELKETEPAENTEEMVIRFTEETEPEWEFWFDSDSEAEAEAENDENTADDDGAPAIQVCGYIPGDEEGYAIGMKPAAVLVGLTIDPETEKAFSPAEIVANIISEMSYTSTLAASAYGMEKDMAGGGLLASSACMKEDIQNVDLDALRRAIGAIPEQEEDYKTKYGFLF